MKYSQSWLKERVHSDLDQESLATLLTMSGFEVEECIKAAPDFTDVVIGQILEISKHPEADQLHLCKVSIGENTSPLQIVCGAKNIFVQMKAPLAKVGAHLPDQPILKEAKIRGIVSQGMLCSAKELGLAEESEGLLVLPEDAPLGEDVRNYLNLNDYIFDISITPNRGDCLSLEGLAREISSLTEAPFQSLELGNIPITQSDTLPVKIEATSECPHYVGRIIRKIKADAPTPLWIKERLRRSGVRSISAIVDITNYVMLELGQPMHAFDCNTIKQEIIVRESKHNESILLLDGSNRSLQPGTLIIADQQNPLAIAGVMGGLESSVTSLTTDIFLESAYFIPEVIAKNRQAYMISSESAYRFERGVDPTIQSTALARATELILAIAGGDAGPVIERQAETQSPPSPIQISLEKINQVLGVNLSAATVENLFKRLYFSYTVLPNVSWSITPPSYRFDIRIPQDIIEEIARLYGYDHIPTKKLFAHLEVAEKAIDYFYHLKQFFSAKSYHEVINYSFIDKTLQHWFDPEKIPKYLINPLSNEMEVMRTNLWPGLFNTFIYNKSRQLHRIRLFEVGACFEASQTMHLGGLITGLVQPEQWGLEAKKADFYDLKGDLENLFDYLSLSIRFEKDTHQALHPGQTAGIYYQDKRIGIMGALHPNLLQYFNIPEKVFVFEIDLESIPLKNRSKFAELSKFPEVRRDISLLVNRAVPAEIIRDTIEKAAGTLLTDCFIFDVYQGNGVPTDLKSIALALIFQHPTRTLKDEEVATIMEKVTSVLQGQLNAVLRS